MHRPQAGTLVALRTRPRPAPAAGSAGDEEDDLAAAIAASLADAGKCWVLRAIVWAPCTKRVVFPTALVSYLAEKCSRAREAFPCLQKHV